MKMEEENKTQAKKAIVRGTNLPISTKHAINICRFLKGKKIDDATAALEKTIKKKFAIPFRGEIPHKKGIPGRYPINASEVFIKLLKSLAANASQQGLDESKIRISLGKADIAQRGHKPGRLGRRRFKRTHVLLIAEEKL
jgi:large subunit ribosomal protein L22